MPISPFVTSKQNQTNIANTLANQGQAKPGTTSSGASLGQNLFSPQSNPAPPVNNTGLTDWQKTAYDNAVTNNLSSTDIANKYNTTEGYVNQLLNQNNLSLPGNRTPTPGLFNTGVDINDPGAQPDLTDFAPPPGTPNFFDAAQNQGQANFYAGLQSTHLSNPNFFTPYGNQQITYDAQGRPTINQTLSSRDQQQLNQLDQLTPDRFSQIQRSLAKALGDYRFQDVDQLDLGGLSQRNVDPTAGGVDTLTQALREREQPRLDQRREQVQNDLITRGFNPGTEGYDNQIDEVNRAENDFNLGLRSLAGQEQSRLFGLESDLRRQGLGEQRSVYDTQAGTRGREIDEAITSRQVPIQEYGALQQVFQPNTPNFQQFTGANVGASPIFDASQAGGLFELGRYGTSVQGELGTRGIDQGIKAGNRGALSDILGAGLSFI